jgi:16S rRNA (cytosine967-C5)-methyltransferase
MSSVLDGREAAYRVLCAGGLSTRRLEAIAPALSPQARAFTHALVAGVERRRATLDAVVAAYAKSPRVLGAIRAALRVGLFQVLFFERVPPYAAVSETVALVRREGSRKAGFVNALLRTVLREIEIAPAAPGDRADARTLLVGGRRLRFGRDVFPDPEADAVGHLAAVHSLPRFLVSRWLERHGAERARGMFEASNAIPPIVLRVRLARTSREALARALAQRGFAAAEGARPDALRLPADSPGLFETPEFRAGLFVVQDETAMAVAEYLRPERGQRILDLCAAPGGKAAHLADLVGDEAEIVACDASESRLASVRANLDRLGLRSVRALHLGPGAAHALEGGFDRVLVDAPCSNTGVLARRPEARWRVTPARLRLLAAGQRRLLDDGLDLLRPGGRLVYSTCSVESEENPAVVEATLRGRRRIRLADARETLPSTGADGGYAAVLDFLSANR